MKTGLVMEGGGMRGMFTAGVIDVFMEKGITFDGAVGTSAGVVFGANIKSEQHGRAIRYNLRFAKEPKYCSFRSLVKTGDIFGEEFCYQAILHELDPFDLEAYAANPMVFYACSTSTETGKAVYRNVSKGTEEDMKWFRASSSMPLVSRPVEIRGKTYLDGGLSDSVPLRFLEKKGYDRNVVVLTQPVDYIKKPNKLVPAAKVMLKEYPAIIRAMEERHLKYNRTYKYIRRQEEAGQCFVIRPKEKLKIGNICHDTEVLIRVYEAGRAAAFEALPGMMRYLAGEETEIREPSL